jgi:LysM repeat protein
MCGASLVEQEAEPELRRRRIQIPWRGILASIVTVAAFIGGIGWFVRAQIAEQSITPTPTVTRQSTRPPTRTPTPADTSTPTLTPTDMPPRAHTVQQGETCVSVATDHGITLEVIQALNPEKCAPGALLQVGDPLLLPAATSTPGPPPTTGPGTPTVEAECPILHVVQPGETALGIVEQYPWMTLPLLEQANGGEDLTALQVNQVLRIPCLDPTATPTPTMNPNATPTPLPKYAPPALLSPPDGATLAGSVVPLQWTAVSLLREDEVYAVRLRRVDQDAPTESLYVRATLLRLGQEYAPTPEDPLREYSWTVTVVRQSGVNSRGEPRYTAASFSSETRSFLWQAPVELTPGASASP